MINKGLRRATGEWIAYLNSDDVYLPGRVGAAGGRKSAAAAGGADGTRGIVRFAGRTRITYVLPAEFFCGIAWSGLIIIRSGNRRSSGIVERRSGMGCLKRNTDFCMDYEYWLRFWTGGEKCWRIAMPLAAFLAASGIQDGERAAEVYCGRRCAAGGAAGRLPAAGAKLGARTAAKLGDPWRWHIHQRTAVNTGDRMAVIKELAAVAAGRPGFVTHRAWLAALKDCVVGAPNSEATQATSSEPVGAAGLDGEAAGCGLRWREPAAG